MHHVCRFLLRCPVACSLSVVLWSCAVAELRRWVVARNFVPSHIYALIT